MGASMHMMDLELSGPYSDLRSKNMIVKDVKTRCNLKDLELKACFTHISI